MPIPFDRFRLLNGSTRRVKNASYGRTPPAVPTPVEVSYDGVTVAETIQPGEMKILDPAAPEFFLRNVDGSPVEIVLDTSPEP